jgi:tetratricopeptide (TPR) repeat protein
MNAFQKASVWQVLLSLMWDDVQALISCAATEAKIIHFHIGMSHEANKDMKSAIVAFRRAVELDESYRDASWRLALALQKSGDTRALLTILQAQCDARPEDAKPLIALGNAYLDLVSRVLVISLRPAKRARGALTVQGDLSKALVVLEKAVGLNPKSYLAAFTYAVALHMSGRVRVPESFWTFDVCGLFPPNVSYPQATEARTYYESAIAMSPTPLVRGHYNLSLLFANTGHAPAASREAEKVCVPAALPGNSAYFLFSLPFVGYCFALCRPWTLRNPVGSTPKQVLMRTIWLFFRIKRPYFETRHHSRHPVAWRSTFP